MKKTFTKFMAITAMLLIGMINLNAQDVLLRFNSKPAATSTSFTFSTTDVLYASDPTSFSGSNSNVVFASPLNVRIQVKEIILELKSTSASAIKVHGMSSGASSTRTIFQVSVSDAKDGTYILLDDVTLSGTKITSNMSGQNVATSTTSVTGLSISKNKFVKISFCTSASGGSTQNVNISGLDITPIPLAAPTISAFEVAGVTATIDESAKTITAELPFGTIITALTPTVTLGGTATSYTPTGVQDFTNPVVYTATDGTNNVDYTVALSVPAAPPAPTITLDSGSTVQALKTGTAITDIVYEITNGTGASVTGLPAGVTGTWTSTGTNQGIYTISGTVDAGAATNAYGFTVTATPISGYVGDDVTVAGTITLKSATALNVLYLNGAVAVASTDIVYPHLNTSPDYILEIKAAAGTAPAATVYDTYDLIIVHESVAGANAELAALKNVDKPILNFKSFAYNSGRWSWGAGDNGLATNKDITVKQPSHPIFTDISGAVLDATLELISAVVASKGIQPADVTLLGSINVATAPKASGVGVAIHDVPASVRGVDTSKYLMIPIFSDSYQHMTATTLKMVDNAIEYLLNGTQFAPPSLEISTFKVGATSGIINHEAETITLSVPMETDLSAITPEIYLAGEGTSVTPATAKDFSNGPVTYTVSDMINSKNYVVTIIQTGSSISSLLDFDVTFDGKTIHNPKQISLQVFDVAGRSIISSNQNIKMNDKQKGIYIIKSDTRAMKINVR